MCCRKIKKFRKFVMKLEKRKIDKGNAIKSNNMCFRIEKFVLPFIVGVSKLKKWIFEAGANYV